MVQNDCLCWHSPPLSLRLPLCSCSSFCCCDNSPDSCYYGACLYNYDMRRQSIFIDLYHNLASISSYTLALPFIQFQMGNTEFPSQFSEKEIQKLYARFKQIDQDNSGDLDPDQIFNVPELNQNPLVKRVISIFDKNKDGKISFSQFLSGLASLYGTDEQHKLRFAFKIYDIDEDGFITNGELFTVLKMMVGNNLTDLQLQQLVDRTIIKADLDYDGKISFQQFKIMVKDLDVGGKLKINKI